MGNATAQHKRVTFKCWQLLLLPLFLTLLPLSSNAQSSSGGGWQSNSATEDPETIFEIQGNINPSQAFVSQVAWVDNDRFLSLAITPNGAEVWRTSFSFPRPERFMSQEFLTKHICPQEYIQSLKFLVSPGKNFIFFSWIGQSDVLAHALVDVSRAPSFRMKRFSPPPGMQISMASFSPDDSFVVLAHDPYRQDCGISLLAINLDSGQEEWRIDSHKINFISNLWWCHPVNGEPKLFASAQVFDGNFTDRGTNCIVNPDNGDVISDADHDGVIIGAEALWGKAWCEETKPGTEFPYSLNAEIPGTAVELQVPLSSQIRDMQLLSDPGRVLISNTLDGKTYQLWLVDLNKGNKYRVDTDCAEFALSANDTLLVRGAKSNQLRVYKLVIPGATPTQPIYHDTGDSVGVT